ncbi:MAG: DUF1080 domain-containing protein, partial [Planctomycetes bacterium]|nr:DUF1080 domain-containing protein [Planctomycetota bacterium]
MTEGDCPLKPLLAFIALTLPALAENALTPEEQAAGWELLFDGQSLKGWRPYGKSNAPIASGWKVEDGALKKLGGQRGGDIITERTFGDF